MLERIRLMVLVAASLSLGACSETPLTPTEAIRTGDPVLISTAPEPTYAVPSTGVTFVVDGETREHAFLASFDLVLRGNPDNEIGVVVESDSIALRQLSSVPVDGPGGGVDRERHDYESRAAAVTRIEPGGETSRAFDVWYTLPSGGREVLIAVTLNFVDDNDIPFTQVHQVPVQPLPEP